MLTNTVYWDQFRDLTDQERLNTDGGRRTRAARKAARTEKKAARNERKEARKSKKSSPSSSKKKQNSKEPYSSSTQSPTSSKTKKKETTNSPAHPQTKGTKPRKGTRKKVNMPSSKIASPRTNTPTPRLSLLERIISGLKNPNAGMNQMGMPAGIDGNWCDENLVKQLSIIGEDWHDYLPAGTQNATVEDNYNHLHSDPKTAALMLDSVSESGTYVFYAIDSSNDGSGHTGTVTVDYENNTFTIVHAGSNGRGGQSTSVITRPGTDPRDYLRSFTDVDYMRIR